MNTDDRIDLEAEIVKVIEHAEKQGIDCDAYRSCLSTEHWPEDMKEESDVEDR